MKTKKLISALVILTVGLIGACKKDSSEDTTTYNMRMTDAPGAYQEVNVNIVGAEVHSDQKGWVALNVKTGVYNLLKLTNGLDTLIGTGEIAVGTVSQIRLILGETNNSVMIDNKTYPLETPSADQSGLKLQVHSELVKGIAYNLIVDFDADKSIVLTGSNTYKLKPVLRIITKATSGAIGGIVAPLNAQPSVMAIMGKDTFSTYASSTTGAFLIQGLMAGKYKVLLMPKAPFRDTSFTDINVSIGGVTGMGTIALH